MTTIEPIVNDMLPCTLIGSFQAPNGRYTLNTDIRRFRTADDCEPADIGAMTEDSWVMRTPILVTLTFNTSGRVIKIDKHGEA